ncbi:hypothetical protein EPN87_04520 [archaeon]|nr:MAG: hypothetical protein EPN87_04520 [archaeon]
MEVVLKFEAKDLQKMKDLLLKDETVNRASMTFKEAGFIGKQGYYCYISGLDGQCKKAVELSKGIAAVADDKEKGEVIGKIKEEESRATEGLGGIFG